MSIDIVLLKLFFSLVFRCAAFMSCLLTSYTEADTLMPLSAKPSGTVQQHKTRLINVSVFVHLMLFLQIEPNVCPFIASVV